MQNIKWKKYIEHLRYRIPFDSVLPYQIERGQVAAKTHGYTLGSSVQVKVQKAQILRVFSTFGAFDYTNNKMHISF